MPQPDSPNIPIYRALGWDNVYVLYWLQMQDGWAWMECALRSATRATGSTSSC